MKLKLNQKCGLCTSLLSPQILPLCFHPDLFSQGCSQFADIQSATKQGDFLFFTLCCSARGDVSLVGLKKAPCVPPHRQADRWKALVLLPPAADKGSKASRLRCYQTHTFGGLVRLHLPLLGAADLGSEEPNPPVRKNTCCTCHLPCAGASAEPRAGRRPGKRRVVHRKRKKECRR